MRLPFVLYQKFTILASSVETWRVTDEGAARKHSVTVFNNEAWSLMMFPASNKILEWPVPISELP